ncbi:MAG: hypothetical protein JXB85_11415 [Anaerolineales bacterium]|nr:hypothetical protein [Anaerolineales bacterium]
MATWIVHLRLAEALLERISGLDPEKFAVGNIAPDSGIPDEKWENFTPPAYVTHFGTPDGSRQELADLEFFRRYLLPLRGDSNLQQFSFRLGYFFHLVTDNLWGRQISRPTKERWLEQFAADEDFIWEVKKDWYGLDFIYVRDHPECLFWSVFLAARPETGDLDFMLPEGILRQVAHIQEYYQRTDERVQDLYRRPYVYLGKAEMDRFVTEAAEQLFRIYKHLWVDGAGPGARTTALDLEIH